MFKIGDRVIVREWNDMAEEFGTTLMGNIKTEELFIEDMRPLCGAHGVVMDVYSVGVMIEFDERDMNLLAEQFCITKDMIKIEEFDEINIESDENLTCFVLGGI